MGKDGAGGLFSPINNEESLLVKTDQPAKYEEVSFNKIKISTIGKIKFDGKWAELFEDPDSNQYTDSCKIYMLYEALGYDEIEEYITNNGWRGIRVIWTMTDRYNFNPYALLLPKVKNDEDE